jgi:hypothetical protein
MAQFRDQVQLELFHRLQKASSEEMTLVLGEYVKRWQRWCTAGLESIKPKQLNLSFYAKSPITQLGRIP